MPRYGPEHVLVPSRSGDGFARWGAHSPPVCTVSRPLVKLPAMGPVTAFLHGAGMNVPRPLSTLDREAFLATPEPKVDGVGIVLRALDAGRLRLLVTFGSIIARTGLQG